MPTTFNMSDVMISYSRKDKLFVRQLTQALKRSGREVWVDWEDIPASADWMAEIEAGIDAAHTFVFVITPNSVRSAVCNHEIHHAVRNNKRLIPILRQEITDEVDDERMHPALKMHNWIMFRDGDDFNKSFRSLVNALETDLAHTQTHTRLLVRAQEWEAKSRQGSFLLRGDDLRDAKTWLAANINNTPVPTALQAEYINSSRKAAIRFRLTIATALFALTSLMLLMLFAFSESGRATAALAEANVRGTLVYEYLQTALVAETQRQIANHAFATQISIVQENQTLAATAGTLAANNQMTAYAAFTELTAFQSTANAAAQTMTATATK